MIYYNQVKREKQVLLILWNGVIGKVEKPIIKQKNLHIVTKFGDSHYIQALETLERCFYIYYKIKYGKNQPLFEKRKVFLWKSNN